MTGQYQVLRGDLQHCELKLTSNVHTGSCQSFFQPTHHAPLSTTTVNCTAMSLSAPFFVLLIASLLLRGCIRARINSFPPFLVKSPSRGRWSIVHSCQYASVAKGKRVVVIGRGKSVRRYCSRSSQQVARLRQAQCIGLLFNRFKVIRRAGRTIPYRYHIKEYETFAYVHDLLRHIISSYG